MNKNPIDMAGTMKLNCSIVYFIATKMLIFVFIVENAVHCLH